MTYLNLKTYFFCIFITLPFLLVSQYQDIDGLIIIEAENLNLKDNWVIENTKTGFTGNGYIVWNGEDYFNSPGNSIISITLTIKTPGTYRVQWRNGITIGSGTTDFNDSWLRFPDASDYYATKTDDSTVYPSGSGKTPNPEGAGGADFFKIYTNTLEWNFNTSTSDNDPHDIYVTFDTAGTYTLEISPRSKGHAIDRIMLYQPQVTDPLNLGNIETVLAEESSGETTTGATVSGELKQYHKVTLTYDSEQIFQETATTYENHRMDVTFTAPSGKTFKIPGYFAADGNAHNTSATSGTKWRGNFLPTETGVYSYSTSFQKGDVIAANPSIIGDSAEFDGDSGSFTIANTDKTGVDFRAKGKIGYNEKRYAQFSNGEHYLEFGADSPETFLEYTDFDNTANGKTFSAHAADYKVGNPSWQEGKGTEIIGAMNYLASEQMNVQYFVAMSITGDGGDTFPFTTTTDYTTYDVSKLAQWEIVFDHMTTIGITAEMVFLETENLNWFEDNEGIVTDSFADSRKIYYREMIARFGHLNGIIYTIGEEANWASGDDQYSAAQILEAANFIDTLTPYKDLISVHNGPSNDDSIFSSLLGGQNLNTISFQGNWDDELHGHDAILNWINESNATVNQWIVRYTEPFSPSADPDIDIWTADSLWAALTAGSAGVHYYAGGGEDLSASNYRDFDSYYNRMRFAYTFFKDNNIPFWEMTNNDGLLSQGYLLSKDQEYYVGFLKNGGNTTISLSGATPYRIKWYNPRNGGDLVNGTLTTLNSGATVAIGLPPNNTNKSWVFLITLDTSQTETSDTDTDNDGVTNTDDQCPDTPLGESVDTNGCSSSQLDDDNDGVPNNIDQCPNSLNGVIVDSTGCIVTTFQDDDNDGVANSVDDCPNTQLGESVNDNGCSINSFPSNQFKITSVGTSCIGSNNGSILIESITNEDFSATITRPNNTITLPFTETLAIDDLDLGEYNLCISSIDFPNYQTCSKIIITEPLPLSVQLDFNSLTNSVTLKMNGAKEYIIEINGKSMLARNQLISIPLYDEVNNVSVSTNQLCQGKFEETVNLENSFLIYPNPVNESLSIDLKSLTSDTVEIAIFTEAGLLIHSKTYLVKQSIIELKTSALSSGIYFLRLKNDKVNKSFKFIKH